VTPVRNVLKASLNAKGLMGRRSSEDGEAICEILGEGVAQTNAREGDALPLFHRKPCPAVPVCGGDAIA
jgi:hypothetical protein